MLAVHIGAVRRAKIGDPEATRAVAQLRVVPRNARILKNNVVVQAASNRDLCTLERNNMPSSRCAKQQARARLRRRRVRRLEDLCVRCIRVGRRADSLGDDLYITARYARIGAKLDAWMLDHCEAALLRKFSQIRRHFVFHLGANWGECRQILRVKKRAVQIRHDDAAYANGLLGLHRPFQTLGNLRRLYWATKEAGNRAFDHIFHEGFETSKRLERAMET